MIIHDFLRFPPGQVCVVTGAGSGIGRAAVEELLSCGVKVAAWDMAAEALDAIGAELGDYDAGLGRYLVDVRVPAQIAEALAETRRDLGEVGLLVNNAGPPSGTNFDFGEGLAASVGSVHDVTSRWLDTPGSAEGSVVHVASVSGAFHGAGPTDWYVAAKAGIAGYTRYLALNRPNGIRANAVAPGIIETPRTKALLDSPAGKDVIARNPMRRPGRPRDVATAIAFLLAPASRYVNGVVLPVDGGNLITQ